MAILVNIKKNLGPFQLSVNFEAENEVLALLGESGSGKSMTLKCIAGIEQPDEGRIVLGDRVLFDSEKKIRLTPQKRRVGYLFQNYALFPNMTVEENISAGIPRSKQGEKELIQDKIKMFCLEGLGKRYPFQLSGGQQQRVALARILASDPEILMLDEPFSALDSYLRWQMEQEMKNVLEKFGGTTLFVSHNRDEVYRVCDKIAVLSGGKLEAVHDKWDLFYHPQTVAAALLTGCKNIARARKASQNAVEVPEWGTVLQTGQKVPDTVSHVGVRAHYFVPVSDENEANVVKGSVLREIEDTFSVIILYQTGGSTIRWELDKEAYRTLKGSELPVYLKVLPKDILLLTK